MKKKIESPNFADQVIKVALATKFEADTIETMLVMARATGNFDVAIAMLLGVYERPSIPASFVSKRSGEADVLHTVVSYADLSDEVTTEYESRRRICVYHPKGETLTVQQYLDNPEEYALGNQEADIKWNAKGHDYTYMSVGKLEMMSSTKRLAYIVSPTNSDEYEKITY